MRRYLASVLLLNFTIIPPAFNETLVPAKFEDQSLREALRKKVFADNLTERSCKVISKDPAGIIASDSELTALFQSLLKGISNHDDKTLLPLFHPQIKVKSTQIKNALTSIDRISGAKPEISMFRIYGLNSLSGETSAITCPEDGLQLHPLYGHPFQVGAWIQATGGSEVSRVYVILVPTKESWKISAWHVQQWTHTGKDFITWRSDADEFRAKSQDLAAWVYYDLAAKLLDGGKFIEFPVAKDIEQSRDKLLSGKTWTKTMELKFPNDKLAYSSSLFSRKGASILFRFSIPNEWSANKIKEHCKNNFRNLTKESWTASIAGIRCDYILPQESIQKDGILGGVFVDKSILDEK